MESAIFHLAIPVKNLEQARAFYVDGLGCQVGRSSQQAMILSFFGHQLVTHLTQEIETQKGIYPRHFGLILPTIATWQGLLQTCQDKQLNFYQKEKQRFRGLPTEHWTFFLQDPSQNLLEFKYYIYPEAIFGIQELAVVGDPMG
jgi:extradiol dioxygenase family protein